MRRTHAAGGGVGERIILCSSCGTKNHVAGGQSRATCEGCGKLLTVRAGLLADLSRIRWGMLPFVGAAIAGLIYFGPSWVATSYYGPLTTSGGVGSKPSLPDFAPSEPVFAEAPVYIAPGLINPPRNPSRAELTVRTRARSNYFVKLVNPTTGNEIMSFYLQGGSPLTVNVPAGRYELRYAAGQVWYGPKYLFGPDTAYAKADELFPFSVTRTPDGWSYSTWTVELILQTGGNLKTTPIDASEF